MNKNRKKSKKGIKSMLDFVTLLNETLENVIIRTSLNGMWFKIWEVRE